MPATSRKRTREVAFSVGSCVAKGPMPRRAAESANHPSVSTDNDAPTKPKRMAAHNRKGNGT